MILIWEHLFILEQDRGLNVLSEAIQRQKLIGHVICDEVDDQNGNMTSF